MDWIKSDNIWYLKKRFLSESKRHLLYAYYIHRSQSMHSSKIKSGDDLDKWFKTVVYINANSNSTIDIIFRHKRENGKELEFVFIKEHIKKLFNRNYVFFLYELPSPVANESELEHIVETFDSITDKRFLPILDTKEKVKYAESEIFYLFMAQLEYFLSAHINKLNFSLIQNT